MIPPPQPIPEQILGPPERAGRPCGDGLVMLAPRRAATGSDCLDSAVPAGSLLLSGDQLAGLVAAAASGAPRVAAPMPWPEAQLPPAPSHRLRR